MTKETNEQLINRLLESRDLLFRHMIQFGCYNKCHKKLFNNIDAQLRGLGVDLGE